MSTDELPDVEATFTVCGPPAQVSAFRNILKAIDLLCRAGASRTIEIRVDGDGATQLGVCEGGKPLSAALSLEEETFFTWAELRPSTLADLPASLRDYSIGWSVREGTRRLVVEIDGCGPPHEAG